MVVALIQVTLLQLWIHLNGVCSKKMSTMTFVFVLLQINVNASLPVMKIVVAPTQRFLKMALFATQNHGGLVKMVYAAD